MREAGVSSAPHPRLHRFEPFTLWFDQTLQPWRVETLSVPDAMWEGRGLLPPSRWRLHSSLYNDFHPPCSPRLIPLVIINTCFKLLVNKTEHRYECVIKRWENGHCLLDYLQSTSSSPDRRHFKHNDRPLNRAKELKLLKWFIKIYLNSFWCKFCY